MCIIRCPNVFISGDGLKLYFSAGMASAAATMFLENRASCPFTVVLTGFTIGAVSAAFCAFAGAAACFAHALPAAITIPTTTTIQLARNFIVGSFSGLSAERILLGIFLGKVLSVSSIHALSTTTTSPSLLHKRNAVTILRPVIHYFFNLQARGAQLFDHHLLRNAMSASVARNSFQRSEPRARREIDNRQPPSRLQRPYQVGIELHRLGQVMVHAPQKNRVAPPRRQIRIRLFALHHDHLRQLALRHFAPQL